MLFSHLLEEKKLSRSDSNQANSRTIKRDLHSLCLLMQKIYHHRIPSHTVQTCPDVILMPMDLEFLRRLPETKIPAFNAIVAKWIRLHVLNLLWPNWIQDLNAVLYVLSMHDKPDGAVVEHPSAKVP